MKSEVKPSERKEDKFRRQLIVKTCIDCCDATKARRVIHISDEIERISVGACHLSDGSDSDAWLLATARPCLDSIAVRSALNFNL